MKKSVLYSIALGCVLSMFSDATLLSAETYAADTKISKSERAKKAIDELKRTSSDDFGKLDRLVGIRITLNNYFIFKFDIEKWRGKSQAGMDFGVFFDTCKDAFPAMFGSPDLVRLGLGVSKENRGPMEGLARNLHQQGKIRAYGWDADMLMVDFDNVAGVTEFHNGYRVLMGARPSISAVIFWIEGINGFSPAVQRILDKNSVALDELVEVRSRGYRK